MENIDTVKGWFAGRLPDGWFQGVEVTAEGEQVLVVGRLPEVQLGPEASAEQKAGAAEGRISRFREQTRGQRIAIAREAEEKFGKPITWGASLGEVTKTFTPGGSGRRSDGDETRKNVMIGQRRGVIRAWRRRFGFGSRFDRRHGQGFGRGFHRTDGPQVY